jgi:hypothetical protein
MTPAAITPAGRKKTARSGATTAPPAAPGHRRSVSQRAAPGRPRRVSGPLRGRTAAPAAPAARTAAPATPAAGTAAPVRPTAPTTRRRTRRWRRSAARLAPTSSLGARAAAFVRALPDHPWLDRVVRGRAWIPILGVMLAGIVAMQVEVLKLGASIGRSIQRSSSLQASNEQLRATVATLDDDQRIEALAAKRGMVMPSPDGVGFLTARSGGHIQRVLSGIRAPNAGTFLALMTDNGAVTTGTGSDPTAAGATPSGASTSAGTTSGTNAGTTSRTGAGTTAGTTSGTNAGTTSGTTAGYTATAGAIAQSETQTQSQSQDPSQTRSQIAAAAASPSASTYQAGGTTLATGG